MPDINSFRAGSFADVSAPFDQGTSPFNEFGHPEKFAMTR